MTEKRRSAKPRGKPGKDVRGRIVRALDPGKLGFVEKGHLEGNDSIPFIPTEVLETLSEAMKSGEADIKISPDGDGGWLVEVTVDS
jgi:hypothetical protein